MPAQLSCFLNICFSSATTWSRAQGKCRILSMTTPPSPATTGGPSGFRLGAIVLSGLCSGPKSLWERGASAGKPGGAAAAAAAGTGLRRCAARAEDLSKSEAALCPACLHAQAACLRAKAGWPRQRCITSASHPQNGPQRSLAAGVFTRNRHPQQCTPAADLSSPPEHSFRPRRSGSRPAAARPGLQPVASCRISFGCPGSPRWPAAHKQAQRCTCVPSGRAAAPAALPPPARPPPGCRCSRRCPCCCRRAAIV
jgi:hypothetical protein